MKKESSRSQNRAFGAATRRGWQTSVCNWETRDVSCNWIHVRCAQCADCQRVKTLSPSRLPKLSLCLWMCPHRLAHRGEGTFICTRTNFKSKLFSAVHGYSSSPKRPSSAAVVLIRGWVWRLLAKVSSNFLMIHCGTTDGRIPARRCHFWSSNNITAFRSVFTLEGRRMTHLFCLAGMNQD